MLQRDTGTGWEYGVGGRGTGGNQTYRTGSVIGPVCMPCDPIRTTAYSPVVRLATGHSIALASRRHLRKPVAMLLAARLQVGS